MSYIPASSSKDLLLVVGAVLVVVAVAFSMRSRGKQASDPPERDASEPPEDSGDAMTAAPAGATPPRGALSPAEPDDPDETDSGDDDHEAARAFHLVAETAWGEAFLDCGERVMVVPISGEGGEISALDLAGLTSGGAAQEWLPGSVRAARLRAAAAPGELPSIEALGHDGDYWCWEFSALPAANAALQLLNDRSIVVRPDDEAEEDPAVLEEQFAAARQELESIREEALAVADATHAATPGAKATQGEDAHAEITAADSNSGSGSISGSGLSSPARVGTPPPAADPEAEADELPSLARQDWILDGLAELIRSAPEPFLCAPLVTPSDRCFPDRWTPDERGASVLLRRLMAYARVPGGAAGNAGVDLAAADLPLADSSRLAGALVPEVARAWRKAKGLATDPEAAETPLADLTCVHLGFGVLAANAAQSRPDGLEVRDLCFALAVQAVACALTPRAIRRWLDPEPDRNFASAYGELKDARAELSERLGLPPAAAWPEAWEHPALATRP